MGSESAAFIMAPVLTFMKGWESFYSRGCVTSVEWIKHWPDLKTVIVAAFIFQSVFEEPIRNLLESFIFHTAGISVTLLLCLFLDMSSIRSNRKTS